MRCNMPNHMQALLYLLGWPDGTGIAMHRVSIA